MPRSNWKGVISFGLVTIPIVLHPSKNKSADITFHQIDKKNNARIKYQRVNSETGKVVPWEQIIKGYEYDKDQIIPVPEEVLQKVAGDNARMIDIDSFIDEKALDLTYLENIYYLTPDKKGDKGYVILREALSSSHKLGIAKVIISTKEYLSAVVPHGKALLLYILKYDAEVNKLEDYEIPTKDLATYKINKKEIEIAKQLINSMTDKWHPEKYKDEYQVALHKWVDEAIHKVPHKKTKSKPVPTPTTSVNFIDLLRKSLKASPKPKKNGRSSTAKTVVKSKTHSSRHATKH